MPPGSFSGGLGAGATAADVTLGAEAPFLGAQRAATGSLLGGLELGSSAGAGVLTDAMGVLEARDVVVDLAVAIAAEGGSTSPLAVTFMETLEVGSTDPALDQ